MAVINTLLKYPFLLPVVSGILMFLGWPTISIFPFLVFAIALLLFAPKHYSSSGKKMMLFRSFYTLFIFRMIWVGLASRWLYASSPKTLFVSLFIDCTMFSIIMLPSMIGLSKSRKYAGVFFIGSWITFEFISQNWVLAQPFFTLGIGLGEWPSLIQIYEFIGIEGGSLLILILAYTLSLFLDRLFEKRPIKPSVLLFIGFVLPFIISPLLIRDYNKDRAKVGILHSYRETYNEKYHFKPTMIVDELWQLSQPGLQKNPDIRLLVWPETLISNLDWLSNLQNSRACNDIKTKISEFEDLTLVTGGYGFSVANEGQDNPYADLNKNLNLYYTGHNVAVSIHSDGRLYLRSKEKFIPFQERIPYLGTFPFFKKLTDVVGSNTMTSNYEKSTELHPLSRSVSYTPILCYESIFPQFMAEKAKESAFIVVMANEYWNPSITGSYEYLYANVPIAIQSRTWILRGSNSGISAVIDKNGNIAELRTEKDQGMLIAEPEIKESSTIYEMISGYTYYPAIILTVLLSFSNLVRRKKD